MFNRVLLRLWQSATVTSWASAGIQVLNSFLVLPFLITQLTTEEISVWYLLRIMIGLLPMADLGFGVTFVRVIAYATGGATGAEDTETTLSKAHAEEAPAQSTNWDLIRQIYSNMHLIYLRLGILAVLAMTIFGTLALFRPISQITDNTSAWSAWFVVLISSFLIFYGSIFGTVLQGLDQIALLKRWETFSGTCAVISNIVVLLLRGDLLWLTISTQFWLIVKILIERTLLMKRFGAKLQSLSNPPVDKSIFQEVWPSAWRSGLGVFMSYGLTQISGLVYAQVGNITGIASYLFALRLLQTITNFSLAPFYSKLPRFASLYSQKNITTLGHLAKRGMRISYWTFVIGFLAIGIFIEPVLGYIGSNVSFVQPVLWAMMGLGFFITRYGAMHLQLYSVTNHIVWHIANGVSGAIYMVSSIALLDLLGVYAFPLGYLIGHLGFYAWYSARLSYKLLDVRFWQFEQSVSIGPLTLITLYLFGAIAIQFS